MIAHRVVHHLDPRGVDRGMARRACRHHLRIAQRADGGGEPAGSDFMIHVDERQQIARGLPHGVIAKGRHRSAMLRHDTRATRHGERHRVVRRAVVGDDDLPALARIRIGRDGRETGGHEASPVSNGDDHRDARLSARHGVIPGPAAPASRGAGTPGPSRSLRAPWMPRCCRPTGLRSGPRAPRRRGSRCPRT